MRAIFESFFGGMTSIVLIACYALVAVGGIYWLWIAIQIGSFGMFLIGLFPITAIFVATPVGAWSILFGVPGWVFDVFG